MKFRRKRGSSSRPRWLNILGAEHYSFFDDSTASWPSDNLCFIYSFVKGFYSPFKVQVISNTLGAL